uniref:(California timema) hypothetical protein n=1 Tax=Timema californicum TaxID=61474 RepID=A0A7R9PBI1_TIMCA|nr:unnamed protein product [Timema californicum]
MRRILEASTDYIVVAGKTDVSQLNKEGDLEHQIRDVTAIIPHSDFRKALFAHDIALLLVSHPIMQAPNIKYVKVPKHLSQDDSPDVRGPCTAIGWGKLNFSSTDYFICNAAERRAHTGGHCRPLGRRGGGGEPNHTSSVEVRTSVQSDVDIVVTSVSGVYCSGVVTSQYRYLTVNVGWGTRGFSYHKKTSTLRTGFTEGSLEARSRSYT